MTRHLRVSLFVTHRTSFFISASTLFSLALTPSPSFLPVVLLLAVIRTYHKVFLPRPSAGRNAGLLWFFVSLGTSLAALGPSIHALRSGPTASIALLFAISGLRTAIALIAFFIEARITSRSSSPIVRLIVFPALWATVWSSVGNVSPIGRLSTWGPVSGLERYAWLMPIIGTVGMDWLVAAWAVTISEATGNWFMGSKGQDEEETSHNQLVDLPTIYPRRTSREPVTLAVVTGFLVVLAIPSFLLNPLPAPPHDVSTTPLNVACVLPSSPLSGRISLTIDDFIKESKQLRNRAHILLWPENAVTFRNPQERNAALDRIREEVPGPYIGVTFQETVDDPIHGIISQNGIALVSSHNASDAHLVYIKQHLVPIAESFSLTASRIPPTIFNLELTAPPGVKKSDWAPGPKFTRPVPLTASICLDFAFPNTFESLPTRPALILGPARTWHPSVGMAMWHQAGVRADELGSLILWCDGGEGGVSGVIGAGSHEVEQYGKGSWVKTIGIQWPFDDRRTFASRFGTAGWLAIAWVLAGGGAGTTIPWVRNGISGAREQFVRWTGTARESNISGALQRWWGRKREEPQQDLLQ